jgi:hypothetical protein
MADPDEGHAVRMVLTALLRCAAPQPWLLAVDDFDRIDDVSRAVFTQLVADSRTALGDVRRVGRGRVRSGVEPARTATRDPTGSVESATRPSSSSCGWRRPCATTRSTASCRLPPGTPSCSPNSPGSPGDDVLPDSLQRLGAALVDRLLGGGAGSRP